MGVSRMEHGELQRTEKAYLQSDSPLVSFLGLVVALLVCCFALPAVLYYQWEFCEQDKFTEVDPYQCQCDCWDRKYKYLYGVVAGKSIIFTPEEEEALKYSANTPGMTLFNKIKEKGEDEEGFGPDYVYIRVTMGPNEGDSPGSPFVVELWPKGKKSPIHNHSKAVAVIKVLFGTITCKYFNPLADYNNPKEADFRVLEERNYSANQVTYLTPQLYQTHQLVNNGSDLCVTIQSYRYLDADAEHYEYFDYIQDGLAPIKHFDPDSDFDLLELRKIVLKEYWDRSKL